MRRIGGSTLLVTALVVAACGGCGDDGEAAPVVVKPPSSTSTAPVVENEATSTTEATAVDASAALPPVLVAGEGGVQRVSDGTVSQLDDEPARVAVGFGDGRLAVQRDDGVYVIADDGESRIEQDGTEVTSLYDVIVHQGRSLVVVGVFFDDPANPDIGGYVELFNVETGAFTRVTEASQPEFGVGSAMASAGRIVTSASADLTELVEFFDFAGAPASRPSPTDDLPYNSPPFVSDAVLSPDGSELAWLEGPDTSGDSPQTPVGDWVLVVADAESLTERVRRTVGTQDEELTLDFDGRWALLSTSPRSGGSPGTPRAIDTRGDGEPVPLDGATGTARFA